MISDEMKKGLAWLIGHDNSADWKQINDRLISLAADVESAIDQTLASHGLAKPSVEGHVQPGEYADEAGVRREIAATIHLAQGGIDHYLLRALSVSGHLTHDQVHRVNSAFAHMSRAQGSALAYQDM